MRPLMSHLLLLLALSSVSLTQTAPGSIYSETGRYSELTTDIRARRIGDTITIVVSDRLTATSQGESSSSRKSSASASISSLAGDRSAIGALANLAGLQGSSKLDGSGSTSRSNVLTTTLTGEVVDVLPNGDLLVQATKQVGVNSEKHTISIRGVVRWNDVSMNNLVRSDRIGQLSVQLNGKGLVSDSIRRPNILYRILMGILPF